MNIQQFLEEHNEVSCACGTYVNVEDHNTRLINFVLSEVEKGVKEKYESWVHAEEFHGFNADRLKKDHRDISTTINNLRVK